VLKRVVPALGKHAHVTLHVIPFALPAGPLVWITVIIT
jgi:hypothetical protein